MEYTGLHLGSGGTRLDDFLNTDIDLLPGVDMALDATKLPYPFKENTFKKIYSSHMIEHINVHKVPTMIQEWLRILTPHGKAIIDCPDLKAGLKLYHLKNYSWNKLLGLIYGSDDEREEQEHKWGWTYDTLSPFFSRAGFSRVVEVKDFQEYHKDNFDIPTFRLEAIK